MQRAVRLAQLPRQFSPRTLLGVSGCVFYAVRNFANYTTEDLGPLRLLTLPPRHLFWSTVLYAVGHRFPNVWTQSQFMEGVQHAVRMIYECLAIGDVQSLHDLVKDDLLDFYRKEGQSPETHEAWSKPPCLIKAEVIGILNAEGVEAAESRGRRVRVTTVLYLKEKYYFKKDDAEHLWHRLQTWTFERGLEDDQPWRLVDVGNRQFLYFKADIDDS